MTDMWTILQWPAMATTLLAAWLIASTHQQRRNAGFICFLLSNALWILWGVHDGAWALVLLQVGLVILNIRGMRKTEPGSSAAQE